MVPFIFKPVFICMHSKNADENWLEMKGTTYREEIMIWISYYCGAQIICLISTGWGGWWKDRRLFCCSNWRQTDLICNNSWSACFAAGEKCVNRRWVDDVATFPYCQVNTGFLPSDPSQCRLQTQTEGTVLKFPVHVVASNFQRRAWTCVMRKLGNLCQPLNLTARFPRMVMHN